MLLPFRSKVTYCDSPSPENDCAILLIIFQNLRVSFLQHESFTEGTCRIDPPYYFRVYASHPVVISNTFLPLSGA